MSRHAHPKAFLHPRSCPWRCPTNICNNKKGLTNQAEKIENIIIKQEYCRNIYLPKTTKQIRKSRR
jgi:hypothetical protein